MHRAGVCNVNSTGVRSMHCTEYRVQKSVTYRLQGLEYVINKVEELGVCNAQSTLVRNV